MTSNQNKNTAIDFVILWVDGNDCQWQAKKQKYSLDKGQDGSVTRYRDWENLKYWFRGVAKFAPWVRKIHFVSDGQVPVWMNTSNPRIHIVNHGDFMPADALPVFNSSAIEVGISHIEGLADRFVYFNDDMFLTREIQPNYYFEKDLPVDMAGLTGAGIPSEENVFAHIQHNNYKLINSHFSKNQVLKANWRKWLDPAYGKTFVRTMANLGRADLAGLVMPHLSVPYLKRDWERCWEKFGAQLTETQFHRFRSKTDLSHFLFRFWRMCQGDFYARRSKGRYFSLTEGQVPKIEQAIVGQTYPEICINDLWEDGDFEQAKDRLNRAFETILPERCEFEC